MEGDSISGVMSKSETGNYFDSWTELTICPTQSLYAQLIKAKRYGRWWMQKALKPKLSSDVAYQTMLRKEFENIVAAPQYCYHDRIGTSKGAGAQR